MSKRVLFLCGRNRLRSPTAERVFAKRSGLEVASAGVNADAVMPVCADLSSEDVDRPTPTSAFVVLPPGGAHADEVSISLPVALGEEGQKSNASIGVGGHLLQIRAATWYESRELGERLRERWRQHGLLWLDPVGTTPIAFSSRRPAQVARCQ